MQLKETLAVTFRLALRESRGGLKSMRLMLVALLLGVAVITAIGVLRDALFEGIERDARRILGGDVSISRPYRALTPEERGVMEEQGVVSETTEMRTMAVAERSKDTARRLVELKGVDALYPLYGEMEVDPYMTIEEALGEHNGRYGAVVDKSVLALLNLKVGDVLTVGKAKFEIRALLTREPDRIINTYQLGPRVLVNSAGFNATELVGPGSLVTYHYRWRLKQGVTESKAVETIHQHFPDAGWRIVTFQEAAPRLKEMLERLQHYISLIGMTVLLTAGMGIANAAQAWLFKRQQTIAVFKAIGATRAEVTAVYVWQLAGVSFLAAAAGLVLGWFLPQWLLPLLSELLPVTPVWQASPSLFMLTALFALLVVVAFSFWPLYRATCIRPAQAFRAAVDILPSGQFRWWHGAIYSLLIVALVALAAAITGGLTLTLQVGFGIVASFIMLYALVWGVQKTAPKLSHRCQLVWRYALNNLGRVGSASAAVVLSLGMGTALLVTVIVVEFNMQRQLGDGVPADAPAYFFLDIPAKEKEAFQNAVLAVEGTSRFVTYPTVRGRLTAIKGTNADNVTIAPDVQWAVRGDRVLATASTPPDNTIIEGEWWDKDYQGTPLVSITSDIAKGMGLHVGDTLGFDILGNKVEATIASIRDVDWRSYRMNFAIIFSPGSLEKFPLTYLATVRATPEAEDAILTRVGSEFPSIAMIRLREALQEAARMMDNIAAIIRIVALFAVLMGAMVMVTALGLTQQRRMLDHTILKVLGAPRKLIMHILTAEFLVLGVLSAVAAAMLGMISAWLLVTYVLKSSFYLPTGLLLATAAGTVAVVLITGLAVTWKSLGNKPLTLLRNE